MHPASAPPPPRRQIRWTDLIILAVLALTGALALLNIAANMAAAGLRPGFGFLGQSAGFDVSESLIPYGPDDAYGRVIVAGVLNTLFLAAVSLVLATLTGLTVGLISVGPSPVGRFLAHGYVELFRNLPKLLVLLVIYVAAVNGLPNVREAISLGPFHLSNRALNVPVLVWDSRFWLPLALLAAGGILWRVRLAHRRGQSPLATRREGWLILLATLAAATLSVPLSGAAVAFSVPELKGFDFQGGARFSLQFAVIAVTLALYHGAQIAEVIRGGLLAIPRGQTEAALSLGLTRWQATRLIILPQVIRICVPPMNNQYVNLIKNTSIAIAVGYSDLMSVSGTIINQTFRPLEMMMITMGVYLGICLLVTTGLNRVHQRLTAREQR